MRLSQVNCTWMVFYLFLVFNFAIFPNRNLVEMILPQGLDRFWAVVYGKFFYNNLDGFYNWDDSVFRYGKSWIYKIYFYSQPDKFFLWWLIWIWVKLFLTNCTSSSANSNKGDAGKPLSINILFSKILKDRA